MCVDYGIKGQLGCRWSNGRKAGTERGFQGGIFVDLHRWFSHECLCKSVLNSQAWRSGTGSNHVPKQTAMQLSPFSHHMGTLLCRKAEPSSSLGPEVKACCAAGVRCSQSCPGLSDFLNMRPYSGHTVSIPWYSTVMASTSLSISNRDEVEARNYSYNLEVGSNGRKLIWEDTPTSIRDTHSFESSYRYSKPK
ncbi:hypothetical protein V6N13_071191 [Hibiscus sabdariffa]|uniref:Seven-in-absentia protein TRAF-like domain-containing protein n=1 Tax=Hibiscus sabdariffa TaxID=183260 RepID=A0ABR1ZR00_9ROSI